MRKILVFDVDGVLADSRQPAKPAMILELERLARKYDMAFVSGGKIQLMQSQVWNHLSSDAKRKTLLFPQSAAEMHRFVGEKLECIYSYKISAPDSELILDALSKMMPKFGIEKLPNGHQYSPQIENRGSQITIAMLGANAPLQIKKAYDPTGAKRLEIAKFLKGILPAFTITVGGTTSIDISLDIDKGYCIKKLVELGFKKSEMIAFADALFPGGNDEPLKLAGVHCIEVKNPEDTLRKLKSY